MNLGEIKAKAQQVVQAEAGRLDDSRLLLALVAAIKELEADNQQLQARHLEMLSSAGETIQSLTNGINRLQAEIERLKEVNEQLVEACNLLIDALEPFKNQNQVPFSGFPSYALAQGEAALAAARGGR